MPNSTLNVLRAPPDSAKRLRVLLVEDHAVVREGLRLLIETQPDMEVVGEASAGSQLPSKATESHPDVVIMDISLLILTGVQTTKRLKAACPHIKIVVLSSYPDEAHVNQALASGASSYVLKRTICEELIRAIRAVAAGSVYLDSSIAGTVTNGHTHSFPESKDTERLSKREYEVLLDVAYGYTNKEVADRLQISVKTVESDKARIFEKLNLATRAQIVRYALQQGWLRDG